MKIIFELAKNYCWLNANTTKKFASLGKKMNYKLKVQNYYKTEQTDFVNSSKPYELTIYFVEIS